VPAQFAAYAGVRPVDPLHLVGGDLVFFADNPGNPDTIHHVGMYIGKGLMVEAPHPALSSAPRPSGARATLAPSAPPPSRAMMAPWRQPSTRPACS
jgi:cell wall-associated NlpC family hydrolase